MKSKKTGKTVAISNTKEVAAYKRQVYHAVQPYSTRPPQEGPLAVRVCFRFRRPKRLKKESQFAIWHTVKPDADNLIKAIKDVLSGMIWVDDCQVCSLTVEKVYHAVGDHPGITISVYTLED